MRLFSFVSFAVVCCFGFVSSLHVDPDDAGVHNVSSPEFKLLAKETYKKLAHCMDNAWMYSDKKIKTNWQFPDDAQQHYEQILKATEQFRKISVHEYAGYEGPWIENMFIAKFLDVPLWKFNGLM